VRTITKQQSAYKAQNPIKTKCFTRTALFSCIMAASLSANGQTGTEAQDEQATGVNEEETQLLVEEIVVKGFKQSLKNAQAIKQNADTFVDAISADDINALPDRSILESIQRLPGVQIGRFAAVDDPDHFGTEGSGLIIRGLTQVRSEFNGRDTFSASSENGLSFQDVSPELMGSVVVAKNQTADMIEGGIGGTVTLNTRKPFDSDGRHFGITVDGQINDIQEEWTPSFSALFSDRIETDVGEFGFLVSYANSELETASHGAQSSRYELRPIESDAAGDGLSTFEGFGFVPEQNRHTFDGSFAGAPEGFEVGDQGVIVPLGGNVRQKIDEREREGLSLALQWESADDTLLATAEFIRSDAQLAWTEFAINQSEGFNDANQRGVPPVGGGGQDVPDQWQFSDEGIFQSGIISTTSAGGWRSNRGDRIPQAADWASPNVETFGGQFTTDSRYRNEDRVTEDLSFNLKWTPTEQWEFVADYQRVEADTSIDDHSAFFATRANARMRLDAPGDFMQMSLFNPWAFADPEQIAIAEANILANDGVEVDLDSPNFFQNPSSFIAHAAMDHAERSKGTSDAFQFDGTRYFDQAGPLKAVKFGVRYSEKDQRVGATRFVWQEIQPAFGDPGFLDDEAVMASGLTDAAQIVDFGGLEAGGGFSIEGGDRIIAPPTVKDPAAFQAMIDPLVRDRCNSKRLLGERVDESQSEVVDGVCQETLFDIQNGFFRPDEIFNTERENIAAYARLDFENELFGRRLAGNLGVRYVELETSTTGATQFPNFDISDPFPEGFGPADAAMFFDDVFDDPDAGVNIDGDEITDPAFLAETNAFLPTELLQFANNGFSPRTSSQTTEHVLPSLNIKYELTPDLLFRFAVSRAISLPDIGEMRNFISVGTDQQAGGITADQTRIFGPDNPFPLISDEFPDNVNAQGEPQPDGIPEGPDGENLDQQSVIQSVNFPGFTATAGNPFLEPTESDQFDVSLEWFFSDVGSLTATLFYKDLNNFITTGSRTEQITNPDTGVTQTVRITGPENGKGGEIKGFEIAYQQTFDFLPWHLDGLGLQANWTKVDSEGVPNDAFSGIDPEATPRDFAFDDLPLERQSDDVVNLVAFYQKGPVELRFAYNYNSSFLLTARDVITELPVWNDSQGFLDASFKYSVTDRFQISAEAKNLNDENVVTRVQVANDLKLFRSDFVQGRSYIIKASYSF